MVRKLRAEAGTVVNANALIAWLDTVTCTDPFTIADARELKAMVDQFAGPEALVDVYTTKGDKVHVRVQFHDTVIVRDLDVV